MSDLDLDGLREAFPEQMERDPTGELARRTLAALDATYTEGVEPTITYVHAGRCGGRLARVGTTGAGEIAYVSLAEDYRPVGGRITKIQDGTMWVEVAPGVTQVRVAPGGAEVTKRGDGIIYRAGIVALVAEPPGFPPAPSDLRCQCEECDRSGTIPRGRVLDDLRAGRSGRVPFKIDHPRSKTL